MLTQAAAWTNVERAISNLNAADALCARAIRALPHDELARLIYPSGYYNSKARKLKALSEYLGSRFGDDLDSMSREDADSLRSELLSVYGIGEETADDILLYALEKPVFVIDNYTRRIFHRLGLCPEKGAYSAYSSMFTRSLPEEQQLFAEYHALIVRHAVEACKKQPKCQDCCLLELCPTGKAKTALTD